MNQTLEKFMKRLRSADGTSLPENIKVIDIENISFQTTLGSNEYKINVWFKSHTGIPNRKTYSYRVGSIEKCLEIKKLMDEVYDSEEDDLFLSTDELPMNTSNGSPFDTEEDDSPFGSSNQ